MFKKIMLMMALGLIISIPCNAQQETGTGSAADPGSVSMSEEGTVSLDFRDADIRNVLQILAFKSGVNIVASPDVTGSVTIQLNNVPWQQALDVILQTYGYAYERRGNIILVTSVENLKKRREDEMLLAEQEALETRTFVLNFGKASEVVLTIDRIKSVRGTVNFDERTNMVIVTDISRKLDLIETVIGELDRVTPQVLIESKIIETKLNDSENLGIDWVAKITATGAKRPVTYPFSPSSGNRYLPDNFPAADEDEFEFGTLNFNQFKAVLEMLRTRTDTNIVSNPKIVVLDNRTAIIQVGTEHPIPSFGVNPETGQLQATNLIYRNIGVNFSVTPHVNNAGFVTLDVIPEVSSLAGSVPIESTSVPLINIEKSETSVMIKDGHTLVIAGLIKDTITHTKKKTPFLGDIPILGLMFQHSLKTVDKTDLMIFITPHIITLEL